MQHRNETHSEQAGNLVCMEENTTMPTSYDRMVPSKIALDMGCPLPPIVASDSIHMSAYIDALSERIAHCQYAINSPEGLSGSINFSAEWRFRKAVAEHALPEVQYAYAQIRALQKLQDEAIHIYAQRFLMRPSWRENLPYWLWRMNPWRHSRMQVEAGAERI